MSKFISSLILYVFIFLLIAVVMMRLVQGFRNTHEHEMVLLSEKPILNLTKMIEEQNRAAVHA